uniref:Zinc finger protein 862-like n=1 Tax=Saccoglossus kowalevskii TaxID=10224 RepID=A0ABM0M1F6_SACKO|nr:PREDICTED: zinc finger protein 862-like [Saccoglossus kowalevskii]
MASKRTLTDFWGGNDLEKKSQEQCSASEMRKDRKLATPRRKIKSEWFSRYPWLKYDSEKQLFFCKSCIAAGRSNIFTTGKRSENPKADDFSKHEKSNDHKFAVTAADSTVNEEMPRAATNAYSAVKEAIVAAMRSVYFVAKEDIAKRKGCKSLEILRHSDRVCYTHSTSVDDFLECIAEVVENEIIRKMKSAKFYSLELDESTDIGICQNLMIYIRGVVDGKIESHFLSVSMLSSATAEALYEEVKHVIDDKGLLLSNLISLGTDGASVMTGQRKGLTTRFKEDNPFILSQHCAAHKLALASGQAADCIPYLVKYQALVNDLYKYHHYSPKNQNKLTASQKIMGESQLKYQQTFSTRWLSFYNSVSAICRTVSSLITALKDDVDNNRNNACVSGLLKNIARFDFLALSFFLLDVLSVLNTTCLALQSDGLTFTEVKHHINACQKAVEDFKTKKGRNYQTFIDTITHDTTNDADLPTEVEFYGHVVAATKKQRDNFAKTSQKFLSCLSENLVNRFHEDDDQISLAFDILVPSKLPDNEDQIAEYGTAEIEKLSEFFGTEKASTTCVDPPVCKTAVINEWSIFKHVMHKYRQQSFTDFWEWVLNKYKSAYPNICILATICLTCPVTSVNVERGFFRYNIVKTALRNSLYTKSVNTLLMVKIEGPDLTEFNFDNSFQLWCSKKDRRALKPTFQQKVHVEEADKTMYSREDVGFMMEYVASKCLDIQQGEETCDDEK